MFSFTYRRLRIYEAFNGYYVERRTTGEVRGIGDGTNYVSPDDRELTPKKAEKMKHDRMKDDLRSSHDEWLEGYFRGRA